MGDYRNDYGTRADPWDLILPVLQDVGAAALIDGDIPRSTAYKTLSGVQPRDHYDTYLAIACKHAVASLKSWGIRPAAQPLAQLAAYLRERAQRHDGPRRCGWCGKQLPRHLRADARYDSGACRKAAARAAARKREGTQS